MTEERSEEARAAGLLYPVIGGAVIELPVLRIRKAREWRRLLSDIEIEGEHDLDYSVEVMLDLLTAYDLQGVMGSRESLEDRATDQEIYDAFKEVLAATFPFVKDSTMMLTDDFTRLVSVALLARASSTNGRSQSGASTRTPSKRRSRTNSSSSSTKRARSG